MSERQFYALRRVKNILDPALCGRSTVLQNYYGYVLRRRSGTSRLGLGARQMWARFRFSQSNRTNGSVSQTHKIAQFRNRLGPNKSQRIHSEHARVVRLVSFCAFFFLCPFPPTVDRLPIQPSSRETVVFDDTPGIHCVCIVGIIV